MTKMTTSRSLKDSNQLPVVLAERYVIRKRLGSGQFGTAYLCQDKEENGKNSKKVVKKIPMNEMPPGETHAAEQEATLLSQLLNVNILKFLDKFVEEGFLCIITEYCEGGDLARYIENFVNAKKTISIKQTLDWFIQILLGVSYIHSRHILHRDLKSRNVFLKKGIIKIGDFGISRALAGTADYASTFIGTPFYMSPELLKQEFYNSKSDIWSVGCILFDMCALKHAFHGDSLYSAIYKIVEKDPPPLPERYPAELNDIFSLMLQKNQAARPSAIDILKMPFISEHFTKMNDESKIVAEIYQVENLRKKEMSPNLQKLTPRQRWHIQKQIDANQKAEESREVIRLQRLETLKGNETLKEVKSKICVPISAGGNGDGAIRKTAWMSGGELSINYPDITTQDSSEDEDDSFLEYNYHEKPISGNHYGSALLERSSLYNFDDRPITPLHETFPSGPNLYQEFEDGIPTTPQLAECYYVDDFEDDEDEEKTLCYKRENTSQDREMMLSYLQDALNYPVDQINTLTTDNTGVFGPEARSNRIKNLRRECMTALGEEMFQKVYQYLWQVRLKKIRDICLNEEEMKGLQEIMKESNYGMMVEQLLFFEEQQNPEMFE